MAQYYALVAGLPNLSLEMSRAPYTQEEFYGELIEVFSNKDRDMLDWLRLEEANKQFIALYQQDALLPREEENDDVDEPSFITDTTLPIRELREVVRLAQQGEKVRRSEMIPGYILRFLNEAYFQVEEEGEEGEQTPQSPLSDEDRLAQLYYSSANRHKNKFIAAWFGFNQTLRNLLALYTCRSLGWEPERYIVGDRDIEEQLLTSKAKDFGLAEHCPYIQQMINIANERDIAKRERMIDVLRWQWLDEQTEWNVFDVESVLAYYIKLGIIERWFKLDEEQGKVVFRDIVMGLKSESQQALQDFRAKTKK